ncbi:MAG: N-acetyl-gamma-glutamyl-phosphate reductase [Cyclobacteriaceae bacterium]|nr:N-acetyl-gamma-glutamyl-phosphate reductase [Cyclobacteriaceae bacterium]
MTDKKIRVGVVGGAGYTGGETVRVLLRHPHVELVFVQSRSQQGKPVAAIHTDLAGETSLTFTEDYTAPVDVLYLCLSHGESQSFVEQNNFHSITRLIDLGNDFRLGATAAGRTFVYGLPEYQREAIRNAKNIANPGCFATTIQLGLLPLAKAGHLTSVCTTGITGSTGAGQKLQETSHFSWRANNVAAYKTLTHQHLGEIHQTLNALQPGFGHVHFVPWRGDFTRGIFVTSLVPCSLPKEKIVTLYKDFYNSHPFTHVMDSMVDIKQVVNTNKCLIHLEVVNGMLAIHSVTDNLLKGAAGQAVQNMNLMMGLEESAGLHLKGTAY